MNSTNGSIPHIDIADIAPFPWAASLHNQIVDATGRNVLEVRDYWVGEADDEAIHDDDKTRAIAWFAIDAANHHSALVSALANLWFQVCIHHPGDKMLEWAIEEAVGALEEAGIDPVQAVTGSVARAGEAGGNDL